MRVTLSLLLALFCWIATGYSAPDQNEAEQTTRNALKHLSEKMYTSTDEKGLSRLGDAASVAITKIFAGHDIAPNEVDQVLSVISFSYDAPQAIQIDSDREPKTTFFVLKCLDSSTKDPELRGKIADTRTQVQKKYDRWVSDSLKK
jgi:hypothetical protein